MGQQKEVEKWITVNGARVPIFKDGSIGGPKALRDKVKAREEKRNKAAKDKAFKEATENRKAKAEKAAQEKIKAEKDKKAGIQKFAVGWDDIGTQTLIDAEPGSKISFEGESWTKIGKDKWKNDTTGKTAESHRVYKERIDGDVGMEVVITAPKKSSKKKDGEAPKDSKREQKEKVLRDKGMNDKDIKTYLDREEKASALDHKANSDDSLSSSEITKMKKEAAKLREQNNDLMYGKKAQKDIAKNEDIKEKQMAKNKAQKDVMNKSPEVTKKFSSEESAKKINDISKNHNNGGGNRKEDWKQVRDALDAAPADTTLITTGDRGMKFQYTKNKDGVWRSSDGYETDSKGISMSWVGNGYRPQVELTSAKNALTNDQIKDTHTNAVNGVLNQRLGLDKNGNPIKSTIKKYTASDKERYKAKEAFARGDISPEEMKHYGFSDKEIEDIREMGRKDALKRVAEGNNGQYYIDPMGNLNYKKTRSRYEQNFGQDFRNMTKAEAKERLRDNGKTNHNIIDGKNIKNLNDEEVKYMAVNMWRYNLTALQKEALDKEMKARGYIYRNGGWHKK